VKFDAVVFLGVGDVEAMHDLGLEREGGSAGVRDPGALESAVMRVQATFGGEPLYPSLALMAAALLAGISRNHPFLDGNKRAAILSAAAFLGANGCPLIVGDEWIEHVEAAAQGALPLEALAELFAAAMGGFVDVEP
jgi:death-on-curing protein